MDGFHRDKTVTVGQHWGIFGRAKKKGWKEFWTESTSNDKRCFRTSIFLGPGHVKWEFYLISVDYQNKKMNKQGRVGKQHTKGRSWNANRKTSTKKWTTKIKETLNWKEIGISLPLGALQGKKTLYAGIVKKTIKDRVNIYISIHITEKVQIIRKTNSLVLRGFLSAVSFTQGAPALCLELLPSAPLQTYKQGIRAFNGKDTHIALLWLWSFCSIVVLA